RPEDAAEVLGRVDALLLTGGADLDPKYYGEKPHPKLGPTFEERDAFELALVREALRRDLPLLAICRGHQVLNVAMGGTLVQDIRTQLPQAINHRRMDKRSEIVHEVELTRGGLLAKITGRQRLGVNSTHHQAVSDLAPPLKV